MTSRLHRAAAAVALGWALAGCAAPVSTQPTAPASPTPTVNVPAPAASAPAAAPTTPPAPAAGVAMRDRLVTPPLTQLAGPVESVSSGPVTGWYATLTVLDGTTAEAVVANLAEQLAVLGATVTTGPDAALSATTPTAQGTARYDVRAVSGDGPAYVQVLSTLEPATQES